MQLAMTVHARLSALRRIAGHSEHQMRTTAGAKCYCLERRPRKLHLPMPTPF